MGTFRLIHRSLQQFRLRLQQAVAAGEENKGTGISLRQLIGPVLSSTAIGHNSDLQAHHAGGCARATPNSLVSLNTRPSHVPAGRAQPF